MKEILNFFKNILLTSSSYQKSNDNNDDMEEPLRILEQNVVISKYIELSKDQVLYSEKYSFKTPIEVLKIAQKTVIWIDYANDFIGFSNKKRSLIFSLKEIKNFEIANMLPAKGHGCGFFSICLLNGKRTDLSISGTYYFDKFADNIKKKLGIDVVFAPEFYNC